MVSLHRLSALTRRRPLARRLLSVALGLVATAGVAGGQVVVTGVVVDSANQPLSGVTVSIADTKGISWVTDNRGTFRLSGVTEGVHSVRAQRVGFMPADSTVLVTATTPPVRIRLVRNIVTLDTVDVGASRPCQQIAFDGFECRRSKGRGLFLDAAAIDAKKADLVGEIFRGVPGFRVEVRKDGIKYPVATSGWRCLKTMVNGNPVSRANPLPKYPHEIKAVEIYSAADDIPKQYEYYSWGSFRCSLIVYWTSNAR